MSNLKKPKFYITTPIYYVNDSPHIGHAYTTIAADALARWHRLIGKDVFFLTGLDEHGQKIEKAAQAAGKQPQEFVNEIAPRFLDAWKLLNISFDDFIRTSEERHKKVAVEIFNKIYQNGDIYKGTYEGWYCMPDESFWTDLQLKDGKCPDCGRDVEKQSEESYFFKLSKYQQKLLELIENNPNFIQPESRRNEVLSFIKQGLHDISISRKIKWGIPVPINQEHTMYVWIDALTNYLSALNYPQAKFNRYWPADLHLMGKEIVRFHAVIWPALLMSAGLELPKIVFGHGWWTVEGEKMSKSRGNVVDPVVTSRKYGVDAFRYFLLKEIAFGQDGDYSETSFIKRINSDLADDLGNLLNRTLVLVENNLKGRVSEKPQEKDAFSELAAATPEKTKEKIEKLEFHNALAEIWALVAEANKYINDNKIWEIQDKKRQGGLLYNLLEALRIVGILIQPFMPSTSENMLKQLGIRKKKLSYDDLKWGILEPGKKIKRGDILFRKVGLIADVNLGT